jgi:hypothetical protein
MQTILIYTLATSYGLPATFHLMAQAQHWLPLSSRVAAALFGGYLFTWGFTALLVASTLATGGDYEEGLTLANMLAFIVFLCVFLWAFAAASVTRVWLVLAGGGAAMTAVAWGLT